jgi:hypothetical protein
MSLLAEVPQGIPFSADEIRSYLEAAAIAGFTGALQLSIGLRDEIAEHIVIKPIFRCSHLEGKFEVINPDPTRKKPVGRVIEDIRPKLVIRPVLTAMEVRFLKGVVQPHWTHDE